MSEEINIKGAIVKKILLFMGTILIGGLIGCSNGTISSVKEGVLEIDKGLTVGQAFDNYQYFKKAGWTSYKSDNGREIVEVTGAIDFDKEPSGVYLKEDGFKSADFSFRFSINKDNTFQIREYGISLVDKDGKKNETSDDNFLVVMDALKSIYGNKPLLDGYSKKAIATYNRMAEKELRNLKTMMEASYPDLQSYPNSINHFSANYLEKANKRAPSITLYLLRTGDKENYIIMALHKMGDRAFYSSATMTNIEEDTIENVNNLLESGYNEVEKKGNLIVVEKS